VDKLPDDPTLHHCLLAYVSDYWLLDTSTMPHGSSFLRGNLVWRASTTHLVSPAGARRRLVAVQPRQPQHLGRARIRARQLLFS
jgi:hypothetical protein